MHFKEMVMRVTQKVEFDANHVAMNTWLTSAWSIAEISFTDDGGNKVQIKVSDEAAEGLLKQLTSFVLQRRKQALKELSSKIEKLGAMDSYND
jgi:hypothetical protein